MVHLQLQKGIRFISFLLLTALAMQFPSSSMPAPTEREIQFYGSPLYGSSSFVTALSI